MIVVLLCFVLFRFLLLDKRNLHTHTNNRSNGLTSVDFVTTAEPEMLLLDLMHAPIDTPLFSIARQLCRIEDLSHVLAWIPAVPYDDLLSADERAEHARVAAELAAAGKPRACVPPTAELVKRRSEAASPVRARGTRVLVQRIELPRLKIAFQARTDGDGVTRLYSLDHTSLFVPVQAREDVGKLLRGIPHSILLSNHNGELHVLVPNVYVTRPAIGNAPFSTELGARPPEQLDWPALGEEDHVALLSL